MDKQNWLGYLIPLLAPAVLAVGMFFTLQANQANLETRLVQDELRIERSLSDHASQMDVLQDRVRALELENARRLNVIETRLDTITQYIMAISEKLDISLQAG